ncbi:F-box/LRR-repeat protein 5 [Folsomia candida]|uniref:F-box/LRR-repeat protein 5 n=1 Tax=Folsomia candida TaxID=158441 RepID=A0A226DWG9_FOLCA|nr:F-box/LRR-repeat protein 5 [Folsomia candida]
METNQQMENGNEIQLCEEILQPGDTFSILPPEIIDHIFTYLNLSDLKIARQVNHDWVKLSGPRFRSLAVIKFDSSKRCNGPELSSYIASYPHYLHRNFKIFTTISHGTSETWSYDLFQAFLRNIANFFQNHGFHCDRLALNHMWRVTNETPQSQIWSFFRNLLTTTINLTSLHMHMSFFVEDDFDVDSFPVTSLVNWSCVREFHVNLGPYGYDITTNKFSHVLPTIFRKAVNLKNLTNSGPIEDFMEGLRELEIDFLR